MTWDDSLPGGTTLGAGYMAVFSAPQVNSDSSMFIFVMKLKETSLKDGSSLPTIRTGMHNVSSGGTIFHLNQILRQRSKKEFGEAQTRRMQATLDSAPDPSAGPEYRPLKNPRPLVDLA